MFRSVICIVIIPAYFASVSAVDPLFSCGGIPKEVHGCLGSPAFIPATIKNCGSNQCEFFTCAFNNAGWLKDGIVQKAKIKAHLDVFAKGKPQWSDAVTHAKSACLSTDLPPQGVYLNCTPYDIVQCCFTSLAQYALPSQWSNEEKCQHPKQYVASCPMCPANCFSAEVPYGSCNACLVQPRSE